MHFPSKNLQTNRWNYFSLSRQDKTRLSPMCVPCYISILGLVLLTEVSTISPLIIMTRRWIVIAGMKPVFHSIFGIILPWALNRSLIVNVGKLRHFGTKLWTKSPLKSVSVALECDLSSPYAAILRPFTEVKSPLSADNKTTSVSGITLKSA